MIGLMLSLAGCSGGSSWVSNLNPFNWGRSSGPTELTSSTGRVQDGRPFVDQISSLSVERTPNGLIITATGVPPTQGWHFAELVLVRDDNPSEAIYEFKVVPPPTGTAVGPVRSREITAGAFLSNQEAATVRTITVSAARNSQSVRR